MDMDSLIKAIRHHNLGIRLRAALALGDIGEPAVKPLIRALKEPDKDVRWLTGLHSRGSVPRPSLSSSGQLQKRIIMHDGTPST